MPAIARRDQHGIDIRSLRQELADVAIGGAILRAIRASTMFWIASRRLFRTSQTATNCTSGSEIMTFKSPVPGRPARCRPG